MRTVEAPQISALELFDICIARLQSAEARARMANIRDQIEDAEADYDEKGALAELYLIAETENIISEHGNVGSVEMQNLYDRHVARKKSKGRAIYDKIKAAADFGQCPFCGQLPVDTLDHALAKARYPLLAVTPINLIPCCDRCNKKKGNAACDVAEAQFLHAYYDDITNDRWLHAEIIETSPPSARFFVQPFGDWDEVISARVEGHFNTLKLSGLYASAASVELQNKKLLISRIYDAGGQAAVSNHLVNEFESSLANTVNSWQTALYQAAAESDWYCDGGFRS